MLLLFSDIEDAVREIQAKKKELKNSVQTEQDQVALGRGGYFDQEIYGGSNNKFEGYVTSIAANDEIEVNITS